MATNVDKYVEPGEIPASVAVPIGGVIMWMNPSAASMNPTPPSGFEFCDGTAVSTVGSPLLGETKPNLMITSAGGTKGTVRGADVNSATYGVGTPLVTAGSDTHSHGGSTNGAGSHNHSLQGHTHDLNAHSHSISSDGNHQHQTNVPGTVPFEVFAGGGSAFNINAAGSHSHSGSTGPSFGSTTGPSSNNTDFNGNHSHGVNSDANVPFHTEVAFIVRVL